MIKTLKNLLKQDKERYSVPRKVQDIIPIQRIWKDGIFQVGNRFSKTYKFSDINYLVASREDKEAMFLAYSELLNSLDSGATTKITINNRRLNKANFEQSILMPMRGDSRDVYRKEYNQMLLDKATGANGMSGTGIMNIQSLPRFLYTIGRCCPRNRWRKPFFGTYGMKPCTELLSNCPKYRGGGLYSITLWGLHTHKSLKRRGVPFRPSGNPYRRLKKD